MWQSNPNSERYEFRVFQPASEDANVTQNRNSFAMTKPSPTSCTECGTVLDCIRDTCPGCGAPDPRHAVQSQLHLPELDAIKTGRIQVWNPWILSLLGVLLGFLWSTVLAALNWHSAKKHWLAAAVWVGGALYLCLVQDVFLQTLDWPWPYFIGLFVWFPFIGLPQALIFKAHTNTIQYGRSWLLPVSIGIAMQIAVLVFAVHEAKIQAEAAKKFSLQNQAQTPVQPTPTATQEFTPQQVHELRAKAVVEIASTWTESSWGIFSKNAGSTGSAVLILQKSGYLFFVTNKHVVSAPEGAWNHHLFITEEEQYIPFDVIGFGKDGIDLALIRVHAPNVTEDAQMPWLKAKEIPIGLKCVAIGNALGAGPSLTEGIVSRFDNMGNWVALRTSAPISPGNSGGALFSLDGAYLIGITTQIIDESHAQNVNQAIPADYFSTPDSWDLVPSTSK